MLWECKTMHDASWKDTVKHGVAPSYPSVFPPVIDPATLPGAPQ